MDGRRWISKAPEALRTTVRPNLVEYDAAYSEYSWDSARHDLDGLPGGRGLNIAHECIDRHAARTPERIAIRWRGKQGERRDFTYSELRDASNRFVAYLQSKKRSGETAA